MHNEISISAARRAAKRREPKWVYVNVEGGRQLAEVIEISSNKARLIIPFWKGAPYKFELPIEVFRECPIER